MGQLAAAGVAAWRVDLLPLTAGTGEHLSVYSLMDLSLDPFPYAGTTTTMESLFMGVPVITLSGGCHAHNVSCSLLAAVGMAQQWVARNADEYVALAVQHAADVAALQQLRQRLRQQMLSSRMCDWQPFVASLEDTYEAMWQRWVREGGRTRPFAAAGSGQTKQQDAAAAVQQQQAAVQLVADCSSSAAAAAAGAPDLTVAIAAAPDSNKAAAAAAATLDTQQQAAAAAAVTAASAVKPAADAQQLPDDGAAAGSCKGARGDQNCGSKKVSSRGMRGLNVELCAAAPTAAAGAAAVAETVQEAAAGGGSSSAHKGRKISSSCDAAATMHAGTAVAGDSRGL